MKIAVVYQYVYPEVLGGGQKRLYEIFNNFPMVVDWYCLSLLKDSTKASENNLNYKPLTNKFFERRSLKETVAWMFLVAKIPLSDYDVVHVGQMPFFHIATILAKQSLLKLFGKKVPVVVVDWWEYWGKHWNKFGFPLNLLGRIVEKVILSWNKNFVVISQKTQDDLCGKTNGNLTLIHNGIDLQEIESTPTNYVAEFIYFGRLEKHKRVDRTVHVFYELCKMNPNYKLVIIGSGEAEADLMTLVYELGLESNVVFMGRVESEKELYSIIKGAKFFLFFGEQEGGGSIALFEANACGTSVVHSFSPNGVDRALFVNGENGYFFETFDSKEIAQVLHDDIVNERDHRSQCKNFVKDKEWKNLSKQYLVLFDELIN